ncbi:hypothetical protein F4604DRAFT_2001897 [Suillus subluteus]|nr:hypothetical protein F4604DRAFT_2001897 [Suillus subluteus]
MSHRMPNPLGNMHAWAFPRNEADQDTEDSYSSTGLSRFGSIASVCGSDTVATSAIYSGRQQLCGRRSFDPSGRRGSCASNLETRMSGLNMRSSQGSLNEAHLNAASFICLPTQGSICYHRNQGTLPLLPPFRPGGSPHPGYGKDPGPSGLRTSEASFGYNPVISRFTFNVSDEMLTCFCAAPTAKLAPTPI